MQYDDDTGKLRYTGDWWLFLAVSVPATLVTVGIWYFFSQRYSRKDNDDENPFGEKRGGGSLDDVERGK